MQYAFPKIVNIDQVRKAIEGRSEFIEANRDEFIVFNYLVSFAETFENPAEPGISEEEAFNRAIRRECRGLTFDAKSGKVAVRKFHKFFNVNERAETEVHTLDFSRPHVILEKLDGSMITPYMPGGTFSERGLPRVNYEELEWHTKMGRTEVAQQVDSFIEQNPNYANWTANVMANNYTPIFEWCSRKQRIVIDHPVDRLVLLAIRDNVTGEYLAYEDIKLAERSGIEVVKQYEGTADNMTALIEETRGLTGMEGWIIRFEDGHMLKVKAEEYLQLHKALSALAQEKDIWNLVLNDKTDDLKGFLPEDQRLKIDQFHVEMWTRVNGLIDIISDFVEDGISEINKKDLSCFENPEREHKKLFATTIVQGRGLERRLHGVAFAIYNGKDAREAVVDLLLSHTSTRTKVDQIRDMLDDIRWDEIKLEE